MKLMKIREYRFVTPALAATEAWVIITDPRVVRAWRKWCKRTDRKVRRARQRGWTHKARFSDRMAPHGRHRVLAYKDIVF